MGFTHYFYCKPKLNKSDFKAFASDVEKVLKLSGVPLSHIDTKEDQEGFEVTDELINFNGVGDNGHETFLFQRDTLVREAELTPRNGLVFNFCKTNQKPYDLCVTATLILAKMHFGKDVKISSDGDASDWAEGGALVGKALGGDLSLDLDEALTVYFTPMKVETPIAPEDRAVKQMEKNAIEEFKDTEEYDMMG